MLIWLERLWVSQVGRKAADELTKTSRLRSLHPGAGREAPTPGPSCPGSRGEQGDQTAQGLSLKQKYFVSGGIF